MLEVDELVKYAETHMLNPELKDGIHGVKHWWRTAKIAEMIIKDQPWASIESVQSMIQTAAVFHDIGRINESNDPMHGYNGAGWLLKIASCSRDLIHTLAAKEWGIVLEIIIHHCEPGPGTFPEMQVVKDADKCDRFRLSEEGPDPKRLALDVTRELLPEIKEFVRGNL